MDKKVDITNYLESVGYRGFELERYIKLVMDQFFGCFRMLEYFTMERTMSRIPSVYVLLESNMAPIPFPEILSEEKLFKKKLNDWGFGDLRALKDHYEGLISLTSARSNDSENRKKIRLIGEVMNEKANLL